MVRVLLDCGADVHAVDKVLRHTDFFANKLLFLLLKLVRPLALKLQVYTFSQFEVPRVIFIVHDHSTSKHV